MNRIVDYVVLPREVSAFERSYLRKVNAIALGFLFLHLPVMLLVAFLCETNMLQALWLTSLMLVGPALSYVAFDNPRAVSNVMAFAAMCLGGLLVHFGQGAMQIEMHFYFFVVIALLAVFGNPLVIVTAATTVALHHFLLYLLLPSSVFNYEASLWTVVVHMLFVVLESFAACFVARTFFDNVIGLERIVATRTQELHQRNQEIGLLLDNIGQGLVILGPDEVMGQEASAIISKWFGAPVSGERFSAYLSRTDASFGDWFSLSWESLQSDLLPIELALEQMPRRLETRGRTYDFAFKPLGAANGNRTMVVISDVTSQLARERAEAAEGELIRVFECVMRDRRAFLEFMSESDRLVVALQDERAPALETKRNLHTLKGNCGLFAVASVASLCHSLEDRMQEGCSDLTAIERAHLAHAWASMRDKMVHLTGDRAVLDIEISEAEFESVLADITREVPHTTLLARVRSWRLESTSKRLQRVADQTRALAEQLNKAPITVLTEADDTRLSATAWAPFWSAFTHVVRNALDHGIEPSVERRSIGKAANGCVQLRALLRDGNFVVEIEDDGQGIDWELVRARASGAGLPAVSQQDLVEALFHDAISTKETTTEISGRGVGMGAVRDICEGAGGTVDVESIRGVGTCFRFSWEAGALERTQRLFLQRTTV